MLVCSPPTLLDKPVKVWDGFKNPQSITVKSVGEIIVAEWEDVVVMDRGWNTIENYQFLRASI